MWKKVNRDWVLISTDWNNNHISVSTSVEKETYNILDWIINYIHSNSIITSDLGTDSLSKDYLTDIRKKILLNFSSAESRNTFNEKFSRSMDSNNRKVIQKYFKSLDSYLRDGIIDTIQWIYKKLMTSDTTDIKVDIFWNLELVSKEITPVDKRLDEAYVSVSNGLVLYIFELCDIGLKTELEKEKQQQQLIFNIPEEW